MWTRMPLEMPHSILRLGIFSLAETKLRQSTEFTIIDPIDWVLWQMPQGDVFPRIVDTIKELPCFLVFDRHHAPIDQSLIHKLQSIWLSYFDTHSIKEYDFQFHLSQYRRDYCSWSQSHRTCSNDPFLNIIGLHLKTRLS